MLTAVPVIRAVLRMEFPSQSALTIWTWRSRFSLFIMTILYLTDHDL